MISLMNRSRLIPASLVLASAPCLLVAAGLLQPLVALPLAAIGALCAFSFYHNKRDEAAAQLRPVRITVKREK